MAANLRQHPRAGSHSRPLVIRWNACADHVAVIYKERIIHFTEELRFLSERDKDRIPNRTKIGMRDSRAPRLDLSEIEDLASASPATARITSA
jgi:hypothetical protein